MSKVVTFGEIMLRLAPEGYYRFVQADTYGATYGGGEANVSVSLANFGLDSKFVTKLPKHEIGQAGVNSLRKFGVDTSAFHFDKVCQSCAQLPPEEKRSFIGDVKRATYFINRDMQRSFRDLEQAIQPDEFSVEAAKPVKAPKAKAEKEPER